MWLEKRLPRNHPAVASFYVNTLGLCPNPQQVAAYWLALPAGDEGRARMVRMVLNKTKFVVQFAQRSRESLRSEQKRCFVQRGNRSRPTVPRRAPRSAPLPRPSGYRPAGTKFKPNSQNTARNKQK